MPGLNKQAQRQLYETASAQAGYFTASQAIEAGYADANHPLYVRNGDWVREHRGIYRLSQFPQTTDRPELMMWYLWSRDRSGNPQGVYSHQTALDLYEVSDLMPAKLHITVPKTFRKSQATPSVLVLHRADLDDSEISNRFFVPVTTARRTFEDLLAEQKVSIEILVPAFAESVHRGLINKRDVVAMQGNSRLGQIIEPFITEVMRTANERTKLFLS